MKQLKFVNLKESEISFLGKQKSEGTFWHCHNVGIAEQYEPAEVFSIKVVFSTAEKRGERKKSATRKLT